MASLISCTGVPGDNDGGGGGVASTGGGTASTGGGTSNTGGGTANTGGGTSSTGGGTASTGGGTASTGGGTASTGGGIANADGGSTTDGGCSQGYDGLVLCSGPVAYWPLSHLSGTEPDLTGRGHTATYRNGPTSGATLPNGDASAVMNGSTQYLEVPSSADFSIPTTGALSFEAWIRPDVLQFPNSSTDGYVDWMGKCDSYSPTCEWEARLYNTTNPQGRCNRLSAYVFNPSAGLGSAADWQPTCGLLQSGQWLHVVAEYTVLTQPAGCPNTNSYPGSIDLWVNGVKWNQASHSPTGCMSQYSVRPVAKTSTLTIGTMAQDTWFAGAIGKVAIYGRLLSSAEISAHFTAMTGRPPTGSCANTCRF